MFFTLLMLCIPVLMIGLLIVLNVFKGDFVHSFTIGCVIVGMISGIRFNVGEQDIYVDLPFVMLVLLNCALLIQVFLKSRINHLVVHIEIRRKLNLVFILISGMIVLLILQVYMVQLYDIGLYIYHINVFINMLLLTLMFYLLSLMELKTSTWLVGSAIYSLANSMLGLLQYMFNKSFLPFATEGSINYYEGAVITKRVMGFVGASNGAGNLGAILFSVLLYYHYKKRSLGSLVILLLNVLFIILTFTRIGYLSVCIQFLIVIIMTGVADHRQWIRRYVIGLVSIVAVIIAYQVYGEDLYQTFIVNRGDTQSNRFTQFAAAFNIFKDHIWFGVGAGQYIPYQQANFGIKDIVLHSQFINILVEQGLVSFILYMAMYIVLFIWSLRKFKDELWLPVSLFVGNLVVVNFNPNQYYSICIYTFLIVVLGLLFSSDKSVDVYTRCNVRTK